MTDRRIIDAEQRRHALDTNESFIVQAPAGSGKTELLTQRYLRLLSTVEHPEEICAITFTRKAAAEMRNRILDALDSAGGPAPDADHQRQTWSLARAAMAHDAELGWQIALNPNRLRIQTFDSLASALARQLPILSEFGATPGTTEQAEPYYLEAARNTLRQLEDAELGPHLERLLTHLDNRQAQLEALLCKMLQRRDQWLTHVLRSPDGSELEAALSRAVSDQLRQLSEHSDADWLRALCATAGDAAEQLADDSRPNPLQVWRGHDSPPGAAWDDLPAWRGLAELLLTAQGGVRKRWDAKLGFPPPSASGIGADEKEKRTKAKQTVRQLVDELASDPRHIELWQSVRKLPLHALDDRQDALLGSLFQVLLRAVAELTLAFREGGEVDFAETQMRAQRALGTPDEPTDLALALDYRLRHLLVDEFQDTSTAQYGLLHTLTASWQPGDGRTLFAVGDPMQSIYRFREAEVGLYLAAREHGVGQLMLKPLTLAVNFRSTQGVIDWVNRSFAQIFPPTVDIGRGAVSYAAALAYDDTSDGGAVQIHAQAGRDDPAEAARVVDLVRKALAETHDGQIAVLARARTHLREIAVALQHAGLGFQAVDVDPLVGEPVVQDLYHLTRALLHPGDRLAWLVVLRSPVVGLDLPDLQVIAETSPHCIIEQLRSDDVRKRLSTTGRQRVDRLLNAVDGEVPARGRRPLRQWIEGIWLTLGGDTVVDAREREDAQAYLALLDAHETAGGLHDFAQLHAALERLYATPDSLADGRIQLMTMHKSKGLEFDTVILPGLGRRPANTGSDLLYCLERTDPNGDVSLLMAPVRAARQRTEPISDYLRDLERDKTRLETTRLLYVAATRARRRLHLLGHINFGDDGEPRAVTVDSLLEKLWPVVEPAYADLAAPQAYGSTEPPSRSGGLQRLPADWRPATFADMDASDDVNEPGGITPIEYEWAGDTARHVGTLVHRQLERIANEGVDAWPATRASELEPGLRLGLRHLGVDPDHLEAATAKALRALENTLRDDTGRWILAAHTGARCEWPLTAHDETGANHFVIDRSFVDTDGVRWIVDYKTGDHQGGDPAAFLDSEVTRYREQLVAYARLVRQLDDRPIRLALYFPLFADWRVWDFADSE